MEQPVWSGDRPAGNHLDRRAPRSRRTPRAAGIRGRVVRGRRHPSPHGALGAMGRTRPRPSRVQRWTDPAGTKAWHGTHARRRVRNYASPSLRRFDGAAQRQLRSHPTLEGSDECRGSTTEPHRRASPPRPGPRLGPPPVAAREVRPSPREVVGTPARHAPSNDGSSTDHQPSLARRICSAPSRCRFRRAAGAPQLRAVPARSHAPRNAV